MTKKENNNEVMEITGNIGASSHCICRKPQKPGFKDVICEVCERIYETNKDVYICPDCQNKSGTSQVIV